MPRANGGARQGSRRMRPRGSLEAVGGSLQRSLVLIAGRAALLAAVASLASGCPAPGTPTRKGRGRARARAAAEPRGRDARRARRRRRAQRRRGPARLSRRARKGRRDDRVRRRERRLARERGGVSIAGAEGLRSLRGRRARSLAQRLRSGSRLPDADHPLSPPAHRAQHLERVAAWDGVRRPVEKSGSGIRSGRTAATREGQTSARLRSRSSRSRRDGEQVFEGVGGLDLVDRIDADQTNTGPTRSRSARTCCAIRRSIREGVELALDPLVPRPAR